MNGVRSRTGPAAIEKWARHGVGGGLELLGDDLGLEVNSGPRSASAASRA
jgi:hypothetical protein